MPQMVQTPPRQITIEEFLTLPDTKPASEYIDGEIIQKPMPQGQHSILQIELGMEINLALRRKGIATAFSELRCTFGGRSIVPDLTVFEDDRIPSTEQGDIGNVFKIYPDWTIEILSPDQSTTRVLKNINHCLTHGTQMGWLIDRFIAIVNLGKSSFNATIFQPQHYFINQLFYRSIHY